MALTLKTKKGNGLVAREMAIELARASYVPEFAQHVPGICNVWSDQLSRLEEPNKPSSVPQELHSVPRHAHDPIDRDYFTALTFV